MTANHAHTPTTRGVRSAYLRVWNGQIQGANAVSVAAEFDRWLATVEAAAEQRGAERALREAAESQDLIHHMYRYLDNHPIQSPAAVRATARYLHDRADRIADQEGNR